PTARETPGPRARAGCLAPPRGPDRRSCRRGVRFKGLDRHLDQRVGLLAPQFARGTDHRIEPLRVLASADRRRVRKDMAAATRLDRPELVAGIARQTGVRRRVDISGAYGVPCLEPRWSRPWPIKIRPLHHFSVVMGHFAVQPDTRPQRAAGGDL